MEHIRNIKLNPSSSHPVLADIFFNASRLHQPVVLFNHGFKGFKDWGHWDLIGEEFVKAGFVFVKFNQSLNGIGPDGGSEFTDLEAFGRNSLSDELADLDLVTNWILRNSLLPTDLLNPDAIHLIGHSRGGVSAILFCQKFPDRIKKLATWAAFSDIAKRYDGGLYSDWEEKGRIYIPNSRTSVDMPQDYSIMEDIRSNGYSVEKALKSLQVPHLIEHGTEDPTVLFQEALALKRMNPDASLFLIPNADHTFGGRHPYKESNLPGYSQLLTDECIRFFRESGDARSAEQDR